ncbi:MULTISPECIES: phage terminase small subunit [Bacillus]|uniref:phage terminase small subunit n=1 Tax=Bacillus TaxID=1386 RepID=UPI001E573AB9|nr:MULTISPECIES: phage terminase small subunit [Bacillus]MCC9088758.1 helix-turn-helix domain-containing protein [Bacillus pumilus]UUD41920.1 phage terminase small subunit [Bacillus pumilus]
MKDKRMQAKKDYMKGMTYQQISDHYNVSIHTVKSWKRRYGWQRQQTSAKQAHSIFNQFLSEETIEIMEKMGGRTSLDIIWDQIQIQYAAIIRAQRIMYVADQKDMIKELKKATYMPSSLEEETVEGIQPEPKITAEEYSFQFSWDRHATFLNAQSRAMGELRRLIKQFEELAHAKDERRLRLKQIELTIEKAKKAVREEKEEDLHIMIKRKEDDS